VLTGDQEDELIKEMNESCVVLQARMRGYMVRSRYAAALKSLRHWRRRRGVALRREFVLANRRHEAIMSKVDLLCLGRGMRALASVFQGLRQITEQMRPLREANEAKAAVHVKRKLQEYVRTVGTGVSGGGGEGKGGGARL
jgi:myosin heavy subunit